MPEEEEDKITQLKESKFSIFKISLPTNKDVFRKQSKWVFFRDDSACKYSCHYFLLFLQSTFVALFCYFCKKTSFSTADLIFWSRYSVFQEVFLCSQKQDLPGEKMRGRIFQRDLQRLDFWEQKELKNTYQRKCCFPQ